MSKGLPKPSFTPEQKRRARETADACKDASVDFKVVAALAAFPASIVGVFVPYGLVAALLLSLIERMQRKAERAADDPPRPDYTVRTEAQKPRVDPSSLRGTPFEQSGERAGEDLRETIAYLSAVVRAVERAQGAAQAGDRAAFAARLAEAEKWGQAFAHESGQSSRALRDLAVDIERTGSGAPRRLQPSGDEGGPPAPGEGRATGPRRPSDDAPIRPGSSTLEPVELVTAVRSLRGVAAATERFGAAFERVSFVLIEEEAPT